MKGNFVNPTLKPHRKYGLSLALICVALLGARQNNMPPQVETLQAAETPAAEKPAADAKANPAATPVASEVSANPTGVAPVGGIPNTSGVFPGLGAAVNSAAPSAGTNAVAKAEDADGVTLSFQGAPIDMVVQWLAKTTEKSVIKHPRVQCQLTIVSSKKMPPRDAINLVYRALGMEGFVALETKQSIFLVPEGQEPKMNPEIVDGTRADLPEGRQRIVKFFPLKHIQPAELREKVRGVMSEKGTIEVDERANQVIATDYTDNIKLLVDLVKEFDVVAVADSVVEIIPLAHLEAEELGSLVSLVVNAQPGTPSSGRSSSPSSGPRMIGGDGPMPMSSPSGGGGAGAPQNAGMAVKIWPDKASNRLIVAAPKSRMPEIRKLIAQLDTEKPQDMALRVVPLKNVSAEDLAREIQPLYQRAATRGTKDNIEITADSRSNALIVLSSESNYKAVVKLVSSLDTEEAQEKVMQAFALKNADAEDVAKQLQDLNQDQSGMSRYFYYYSSMERGGNNKKLSVVADRRRNTVIVQGPPSAMEKVAKMIETLDQPVTDNSLAPKIYPLKFVSATDLEDVLNELFLKKTQQRTYWYYDDYPSETADKNVGRLYGKVRITSEPFSNSLIITANSAEHLTAVEEVIKKLDAPSEAGDTTLRVNLQFAKAINVANSINILFAKAGAPALRQNAQQNPQNNDQRNPNQQQNNSQSAFGLEQEAKEEAYFPWLGGQQDNSYYRGSSDSKSTRPVSDLVGRIRVVPDHRGNGLLVTCNVHFFPQIMKLVNELDAPTPQVMISARILEISSDFRDKLGVRWTPATAAESQFTGDDFDNGIMFNNSGSYNKVFAGSALADALTKGVLNSKVDLDILVQALRKNTDATVLAEPKINIADNEMGKLFVGAQVPFLTGSLNTDVGGRNDSYSYKDVGVILEVTPRINNAEEMALKIRAESSTLRNGETINGGVVIDTRNFRTELMLTNGQTAVLGGIINRQQQNIVRKVPVLGSIPGLGWLFKKKDKTTTDVELMVFLSPKITRTPEQAKKLLEEEENSAPKLKQYNLDEKAAKDAAATGKPVDKKKK